MEIVVSVFAVLVGLGCFYTKLTNELSITNTIEVNFGCSSCFELNMRNQTYLPDCNRLLHL